MKKQRSNPFEGLEGLSSVDFGIIGKDKSKIEEKILDTMNSIGIRIQSVVLPPNFVESKNENMVLDWMRNNIKSVHTSCYYYRLKYQDN
jgi:hypothetical protein